jgi:hypothetical protein
VITGIRVLSFAQQKQLALRYRFYHPTGIGKIANVMVTQNRNFFARIASAVLSFIGRLTIVLTMACTSVCFFGFELQPTKKKPNIKQREYIFIMQEYAVPNYWY